jgi:hypothetical protein
LKCAICYREAVGKESYCKFHSKAYENLVRKYDSWKRALELSWKEYLSEVVKNSSTGEWVKEVAQHLINNEEKHDVQES